MTADIARITYDPTRQYRSVIYQQGRVTLEADNNEAAILAEEALRLETIDIVGPTGALGNGYAVSSGKGPGGVVIGAGTFYLGGWRLHLDKPFAIPGQLARGAEAIHIGPFVVALLLTEQSVCAIEDQALREPALGGPDSAARMRLMQSFPQAGLTGNTCAIGATTIAGLLAADGVTIDSGLQLQSSARLQAGFVPGPSTADPCTPTAAGGYLGADNQMVRVTVTEYNATAKTGMLLWGFNNASLLYRATATGAETLTLTNTPVDQEHAPQQTQMVEILRTELDLTDNNYIAEAEGFVTSLAQGYSFDSQTIVLGNPLPTAYQNNKTPLFVRVWQAAVPFNNGQVTPLDNTSGITVTITMTALPSNIAARPFWHFSVRPAMPNNIFPQRYADTPQPPDGPRQWITDLAVLESQGSGAQLLADCRIPFVPLTQQTGGCCGLVLGPAEVAGRGGLQAVVDSLTMPAVLSLRPGSYPLTAPLALTAKHDGLTIEGCALGAVLEAVTNQPATFRLGLVTITGGNSITLRRIDFTVPPVPATGTGIATGISLATFAGLNIVSGAVLTIEDCVFILASTTVKSTGGGGIMVTGDTRQVIIRRNRFSAAQPGFLTSGVFALFNGENAVSRFDQWEISNNVFTGLGSAVLAYAQLGLVRCTGNLVTQSAAGFIFYEANLGATGQFTQAAQKDSAAGRNVQLAQAATATLRPDILANALATAKPILDAVPAPATTPKLSEIARKVLTEKMTSTGADAYKTLSTATVTGAAAPAGAAPAGAPPASGEVPAATLANSGEVSATVPVTNANASNFNAINEISASAEAYESALTPALRIDANEITLVSTLVSAAWAGIGVTLSLDEPGSVIVTGNRVVVPDASAIACGILFPVSAVVTGNLFAQLAAAPKGSNAQFCMSLITTSPAIMVSANMTSFFELVLPPRNRDKAVPGWDFLNTTG